MLLKKAAVRSLETDSSLPVSKEVENHIWGLCVYLEITFASPLRSRYEPVHVQNSRFSKSSCYESLLNIQSLIRNIEERFRVRIPSVTVPVNPSGQPLEIERLTSYDPSKVSYRAEDGCFTIHASSERGTLTVDQLGPSMDRAKNRLIRNLFILHFIVKMMAKGQ